MADLASRSEGLRSAALLRAAAAAAIAAAEALPQLAAWLSFVTMLPSSLRSTAPSGLCTSSRGVQWVPRMRLAHFIDLRAEDILAEWEQFAATRQPAASSMGKLALRDHAPLILRAIAIDLRTSQNPEQQRAKAEGRAPVFAGAPRTAAEAASTSTRWSVSTEPFARAFCVCGATRERAKRSLRSRT